MKSNLKVIVCILFLSIAMHMSGTAAATVTYMSNFIVPARSSGVKVDKLNKTIDGYERFNISSYFNRNLKARIVSTNSFQGKYDGDTGYYWTLKINDGFNNIRIATDQYSTASALAHFQGDKTLYLKTSGYWYDTTSVTGQWYVNG